MGAGKDGKAQPVDVCLEGGLGDHLGGLADAGVDTLHAGVAEGAGHHLGAAVVPVEAGLSDEDTYLVLLGHQALLPPIPILYVPLAELPRDYPSDCSSPRRTAPAARGCRKHMRPFKPRRGSWSMSWMLSCLRRAISASMSSAPKAI